MINYEKEYNEALERAKKLKETCDSTAVIGWCEYLFPSLKESEGERIKREIIEYIKTSSYQYHKDWIAWLEKQGEQKPADKVEAKFKIGDWVVINPELRFASPLCIKNIDDNNYRVESLDGNSGAPTIDYLDNHYHLWTIEGAKNGDVLVYEGGWTCIFKTLVNDETFSSYCFMDSTGWFCGLGSECHSLKEEFVKAYNGKIQPATKEQRDFFFAKMQEAGYEWNAEKKMLILRVKKSTHPSY